MTDNLILAAASGSDGGLGKIGTIPQTTGVLYVRCPLTSNIEKLEWLLKIDRNCTYQLYRAHSIVQAQTLTLSGLLDGENLVINGLTFIAEDTAEDAVASARKFYTGGADATADATALVALINDATYGVPGVVATNALGVVTIRPKASDGAYALQAVTGTAAGHCAVADTTLASLIRDGASVSHTAVTTDAGVLISQTVNGWEQAYIGISAPAAGAATAVVAATRYRYRD
jgi:hypothetical protein